VYESALDRCASGPNTVAIEVGVWKGLSASYIAEWMKKQGGGVLFAVDTWTGSPEHWLQDDLFAAMRVSHGRPTLYETFLSNMMHESLSDFVVPFPVSSRVANAFFRAKGLRANLVHINAAHEYEDVKEDITLWWPALANCGILMGDDYDAGWPGVMRAVDELANRQGVHLELLPGTPKWLIAAPCTT